MWLQYTTLILIQVALALLIAILIRYTTYQLLPLMFLILEPMRYDPAMMFFVQPNTQMLLENFRTTQANTPRHLPSWKTDSLKPFPKIQPWACLLLWISIPTMETSQSVDSISYYVVGYEVTPPKTSSTLLSCDLKPNSSKINHPLSSKVPPTKQLHWQCTNKDRPS